MFATSAEIIGGELKYNNAEDSFSFLSTLKNSKTESLRKALVHHSIDGLFSVRKGKWKLALTPGSGGWSYPRNFEAFNLELPMVQLYDLENDIGETKNIQDQYPEVVNELINMLQQCVNNGRTTQGEKLSNDVAVNVWKYLNNRRSNIKLEKIEHSAIKAESLIINNASVKYSAEGIDVLTDGFRGTENYSDGFWAGFEGEDLEIEIYLNKKQNINSIKIGSLENQGSWIFFPKAIRIYTKSADGKYELVGSLPINKPRKNESIERKDFVVNIDEYFTDNLKVKIESIKTCPNWHPGNGNKAWMFIDEIIVE
jgi:hypothetical protein